MQLGGSVPDHHLLMIEFLRWVSERPRMYADVMEVWRTSCLTPVGVGRRASGGTHRGPPWHGDADGPRSSCPQRCERL